MTPGLPFGLLIVMFRRTMLRYLQRERERERERRRRGKEKERKHYL